MSAAAHLNEPEQRQQFWAAYLAERTGTFEWRCRRYAEVADELESLGLANDHLIYDIGAGACEFDRYLRCIRGWHGRYVPIDGAIDGTELEEWDPPICPDFFVCIEVLEHLHNPWRMLNILESCADIGSVITTPNPAVVNVLDIDRTHVSSLSSFGLQCRHWNVRTKELFNHGESDTLIATHKARI